MGGHYIYIMRGVWCVCYSCVAYAFLETLVSILRAGSHSTAFISACQILEMEEEGEQEVDSDQ